MTTEDWARWPGAPEQCQAKDKGLTCSRDKHAGNQHQDPRYGLWQEKGELAVRAEEFAQLHHNAVYEVNREGCGPVGYTVWSWEEMSEDHRQLLIAGARRFLGEPDPNPTANPHRACARCHHAWAVHLRRGDNPIRSCSICPCEGFSFLVQKGQ